MHWCSWKPPCASDAGDKGKRNMWKETDFKPLLSEVESSPTPHLVSYLGLENLGLDLGQSLMHRAERESQFLSNTFPSGLNPKSVWKTMWFAGFVFHFIIIFFTPPPSSLNTSSLKTIKPVSQMWYGCCFFICWIENHTWGIKWLTKWQWAFKNKNAGHLTKNGELSW